MAFYNSPAGRPEAALTLFISSCHAWLFHFEPQLRLDFRCPTRLPVSHIDELYREVFFPPISLDAVSRLDVNVPEVSCR